MRVKHKETGNILGVEYLEWYNNYIKKGIYKKFEIVDYSGVVELQTLQKDGSMKKQPFDKSSAINNQRQFSNKMFIEKKLSFETYDKWLVMGNQPFLRKKNWYNLPAIKQKLETITKSNISKEAWFVIRGITIIVIASIIITALK
jgi:hypothetical protein|tara:strand:- start:39 stop:473 length:435 start_codon:yes stop_codon:yes gene_type:complete